MIVEKQTRSLLLLSLFALFIAGCTSFSAPVFVGVTPQQVRVKAGETASMTVLFQRQYTGEEQAIAVSFLDQGLLEVVQADTLKVTAGTSSLTFQIKGIKAGKTWAYVNISGRDDKEKTKVLVEVME